MGRFVQVWWPVGLAISFGCVGFMAGRENADRSLLADAKEHRSTVYATKTAASVGICPTWRLMTLAERGNGRTCSKHPEPAEGHAP